MEFTATGLIKISTRKFARNWNDLFVLANKTTSRQQSLFKTKYSDSIKSVTYVTTNVHGESRVNTYLVASQELAGNTRISDLQIKAFYNTNHVIKTNKDRFVNRVTKELRLAFKMINESLEYNFDCKLVNGAVVNTNNEIVYTKEKLFKTMLDISRNVETADAIVLNTITILYTELSKKVIIVEIDEDGNRSVASKDIELVKEEIIAGITTVETIDHNIKTNETIITIKPTNNSIRFRNRFVSKHWSEDMNEYKDISHYNDAYYEKSFYLTENDISDLDIFFTADIGNDKARIIREPITYFNIANYVKTKPVYQVGSNQIVAYSSGINLLTGKIIINAFSNIPLINTLIATKTVSSKLQDIPLLDMYIINKKNPTQLRTFQDLVIKNVKYTSYNFEQGTDTPGRFFVIEFIAAEMQGIHLKDYIREQAYGNGVDKEPLTEINLIDIEYQKELDKRLEEIKEKEIEENTKNKIIQFIKTCNLWAGYTYLGKWIQPVNYEQVKIISKAPLTNELTQYIKSNQEYEEYRLWLLDQKNIRNSMDSLYQEVKYFYDKSIEINPTELYEEAGRDLDMTINKTQQIIDLYAKLKDLENKPILPTTPNDSTQSPNSKYKLPTEFKISNEGLQLIMSEEGLSNKAYWDVNGYSIGYGSKQYEDGSAVQKDDYITDQRAKEILLYDVNNRRVKTIQRSVKSKISQCKFDALCSLVYNIGSFTNTPQLLKAINLSQFNKAADIMLQINKAGGVVLPVLVKRRKREATLFLKE